MRVIEKEVNFRTQRGGWSNTGWFMDYTFSERDEGYRVLYSYGQPIVIMPTKWDDKKCCMKPLFRDAVINLEYYKASKTTAKHRCLLLGEYIGQTDAAISSGYYRTVNYTEEMRALIRKIKGGEMI